MIFYLEVTAGDSAASIENSKVNLRIRFDSLIEMFTHRATVSHCIAPPDYIMQHVRYITENGKPSNAKMYTIKLNLREPNLKNRKYIIYNRFLFILFFGCV